MPSKNRREEELFARRIEELCNSLSELEDTEPQTAKLLQELEQVLEQFKVFRKMQKMTKPY